MKKIMIFISVFLLLLVFGVTFYISIIFQNYIPVLAYHDVVENPSEETDIHVDQFEKQMKYLKEMHYKTLSLDEFYAWKHGEKIDGKKTVLTFDDGKESFYTTVVPLLEKYDLKGTIFVIQSAVGQVGYLTQEQLEDLRRNHPNITVASHSYSLHDEVNAKSNNYTIYNQDMLVNQENNYSYYAYPFGIMNDSYKKALKDNHYKLAFLFSPSQWSDKEQDDYEITRVPIYRSNPFWKFKLKLFLKI